MKPFKEKALTTSKFPYPEKKKFRIVDKQATNFEYKQGH